MKHRQAANVMGVAVVAAVAGAGIALLTAPRSGKETRARMRFKADKLKFDARQKATHMQHQLNDKMARTKSFKDNLIESFRSRKQELDRDEADREALKSSLTNNWNNEEV